MFFQVFKQLFEKRDLLIALTLKELKTRYKSTMLGFLWAFLNPLFQMIVLSIIFTVIVRIQVEKYPLFLFAGLLPWMFFNQSLISGTRSLINNRELIKKAFFPREILPLSSVFSNLVNFLLSLLVFLPALFVLSNYISFNLLLLPVIILLQIILTIGIVLVTSSLNIYYRDVSFVVQALILAWFYLTPVIYPLSMVPKRFISFYSLNPMVGIISLYHFTLLGRSLPSISILLPSFLLILFIFTFGIILFKKREPYFADWV
ncbi:MAG: ABC transporter permease [Candidatus Aminicenantia bacterium]